MKKTICICVLAAVFTISGITMNIAAKRQAQETERDKLPMELSVTAEETELAEEPELVESMAAPEQYEFVIFVRDGVLVVYQNDRETEYFETNIRVSDLDGELAGQLETGIYFLNEQELYDFLESYSS